MIIGLNLNHDYALCKLTDQELNLIEFERISRIRNHWVEPECYTLALLDQFSEDELASIELICLNSANLKHIQKHEGDLSTVNRSYIYKGLYPSFDNTSLFVKGSILAGRVNIPAIWISHYHAHAASGYFPSGFSEADILCLDGGGDYGYGAWFEGETNHISLQERLMNWNFGFSYNLFSRRQLQKNGFHEGKIMALAAFGDYRKSKDSIFTKSGLLPNKLKYPVSVHTVAKMQREFEESILDLLKNKENRKPNLVCTGGCFLNVQLNSRIASSGLYESIFIPPFVGDMGTAIGCALIGALYLKRKLPSLDVLQNPFLGENLSVERDFLLSRIGGTICD